MVFVLSNHQSHLLASNTGWTYDYNKHLETVSNPTAGQKRILFKHLKRAS